MYEGLEPTEAKIEVLRRLPNIAKIDGAVAKRAPEGDSSGIHRRWVRSDDESVDDGVVWCGDIGVVVAGKGEALKLR